MVITISNSLDKLYISQRPEMQNEGNVIDKKMQLLSLRLKLITSTLP